VFKGIGMGQEGALARTVGTLAVLAMLAGAAGCSSVVEVETEVRPRMGCVDDSPACIAQRQAALRVMLADPKRNWVREPADADAYAAGVRLFAYKQRKRDLSCVELTAGRREADAGPGTLRGPAGRHLTPAQISRGAMLAGEVSRELASEMKRKRCPA
jgi:hypothetical protein